MNGREGERRIEAQQALLYHFLKEVDCADFKPKAHAPGCAAKREMSELTDDDAEILANDLAENPLSVLGDRYRYAVTFETLLGAFLERMRRNFALSGDHKRLRVALRNRGFEYAFFQSRKVRGAKRRQVRLVIIDAEWRRTKKNHEVYEYFMKNLGVPEKGPYEGGEAKRRAYDGGDSPIIANRKKVSSIDEARARAAQQDGDGQAPRERAAPNTRRKNREAKE